MILLCGIPSEGPVARLAAACEQLGLEARLVNQRRFAEDPLVLGAGPGDGTVTVAGEAVPLAAVTGLYLRAVDPGVLPEVAGDDPGRGRRAVAEAWLRALLAWSETTPARVANRPSAMASNSSKPYQAQLVRAGGFAVPETLVTSDPEAVLAFRARHRRLVYKSTSSVRSVVRELGEADLARLGRIRRCPTQFQELVEGEDVRVHVVGEEVFATAVRSPATDYRYPGPGQETVLEPAALDAGLAARCVALAAALGLGFAGIDLRRAADGRVVCFEVNPSPAYSYYEAHTGQPIAAAVARWLAGQGSSSAGLR